MLFHLGIPQQYFTHLLIIKLPCSCGEMCIRDRHPCVYEMKYEAAHIHACLKAGLLESPILRAEQSVLCCFLVDEILRQLSQQEVLCCIDPEERCYDI